MKNNIALISSPLQALVIFLIIKTDKSVRDQRFTLLVEGDLNFPSLANVTVLKIFDTRGCKTEAISKNIKIIDRVVKDKCTLWLSDIFWPMNNIALARLLKSNFIAEVNIIDEGIVLYLQTRVSVYKYIRELFKIILVMFHCGRRVAFIGINPFHNIPFLKSIYAIHPNLLKKVDRIKSIDISPAAIHAFNVASKKRKGQGMLFENNYCEIQVLTLNQPYYRISGHYKYKQLIHKLNNFVDKLSPNKKFVRLHPSDDKGIYSKVFMELGYLEDIATVGCPVEVDLAQLSDKTILISINSSALLNAKRFGFRGTVISFGLDWLADIYPMQKSMFLKQEYLFNNLGVSVQNAN